MESIYSKDGTLIAFERGGSGPPLVVVHGTSANHNAWSAVLPAFNNVFTVYALDRRGRGLSGDGATYAIEREYEDIAAVIDSIGEPVDLCGHSYGALCALGYVYVVPAQLIVLLFDPLARTCRFMLTEEAHHMFVGETGVSRILQRTCEVMNEHKVESSGDVRALGVIDLETMQRYLNFHYA